MSIAAALAGASAKPAGKRPYFLDPALERTTAIVMALVQELAVARQRVDTLERLLEQKGVLNREEIETFSPDAAQAAERGLWTQEYLCRVLRILQQEAEAIGVPNDVYSEDLAREIGA